MPVPLRKQCTKTAHPSQTRLIVRPDGHEFLLQGWAQADSPEAKRDRRRRMTLIEGSFGQAAQNHHFKRARYRRLWRQCIQDHLVAAVQNIKKIIQHAARAGTPAILAVSATAYRLSRILGQIKHIFGPILPAPLDCWP